MHALRSARQLARLLLAWFALSLGVAIASPLLNPHGLQMVCTGKNAMKLVTYGEDGKAKDHRHAHSLDCPLCAAVGAPPPVAVVLPEPPHQPLAHALTPLRAAHLVSLTAAPLPARGPPLL